MDNIIGRIWSGGKEEYVLFYKDDVLMEKNANSGEERKSVLKHVAYALTNPWDKIRYYEEDGKHHWFSIVYDSFEIDIWENSIEELMDLIAYIIREACEECDNNEDS